MDYGTAAPGWPSVDDNRIESLLEDLHDWLATGLSKRFHTVPGEDRVDGVLRAFDSFQTERERNALRLAVYRCLDQLQSLTNVRLITDLLTLVDELRVTRAKPLLASWATMPAFIQLRERDGKRLKRKLLSVLFKFDLDPELLRMLLDVNLTNPAYTEVCLTAYLNAATNVKLFIDQFHLALRHREQLGQVDFPLVLRLFMMRYGPEMWSSRAGELLMNDEEVTVSALTVLDDAAVGPEFSPIDNQQRSFELRICWPFGNVGPVHAILPKLTAAQREALYQWKRDSIRQPLTPPPTSFPPQTGGPLWIRPWGSQ